MSGMNYELLKLSRILPTINGKPTLDIYKESLERARKNYQLQQERVQDPNYNEHEESTEDIISAWEQEREVHSAHKVVNDKKPNKRTLKEVKSADRIMKSSNFNFPLNNYQNLNALLNSPIKEEGSMSLYRAVSKTKSRKIVYKSKPPVEIMTADNFFCQRPKVQIHSQHENPVLRPGSCNTPSNFVFRKKKGVLRNGSDAEHNYQYTANKDAIPEDAMGLNGLRLHMEKTTGDSLANQHKNFLKNMKPESHLTFQDRFVRNNGSANNIYANGGFRSPTEERRVIQTAQASNLLARSSSRNTVGQQHQTGSTAKMNTLMVDGTMKLTSPKKANGFIPIGQARGYKTIESEQVTVV